MDANTLAQMGITCDTGKYPFPVLEIKNSNATAKISLYGGHVISYIPVGEQPVLWMSSKSWYEPGKPLRGGVPVCWPYFGPAPVDGCAAHGFVRTAMWELHAAETLTGDTTKVVLKVDEKGIDHPLCSKPFELYLTVTVGAALELELRAVNKADSEQTFQAALHTYFAVSESEKITVTGLDKTPYLDKAPAHAGENRVQCGDLEIDQEIDRVFCPTSATVKIADPVWRRTLVVEKSGSLSTVVWNPWISKSKAMPDFGDNEYHRMLCVECGNVLADSRTLVPGAVTVMTQKVSVEKWD